MKMKSEEWVGVSASEKEWEMWERSDGVVHHSPLSAAFLLPLGDGQSLLTASKAPGGHFSLLPSPLLSGPSGTTPVRHAAQPEALTALAQWGGSLVGGGPSGTVYHWDPSGQLHSSHGHWGGVTAVAVGPLGTVTGGSDAVVTWWAPGGLWVQWGQWHRSALPITALQWWGCHVTVLSQDRWLRLWSPRGEGAQDSSQEGEGVLLPAQGTCLGVTGEWAVVGLADGSLGLVSLPALLHGNLSHSNLSHSNGSVLRQFAAHSAGVSAVAVLEETVLSGGVDGTVGVWELHGTGTSGKGELQLLRVVQRHESPITALLLLPLGPLSFPDLPPVEFLPPNKYPSEVGDPFSEVCEDVVLAEQAVTPPEGEEREALRRAVCRTRERRGKEGVLQESLAAAESHVTEWRTLACHLHAFCSSHLLR